MNAKQAEQIHLLRGQQYTYQQAADFLGLKVGTVKAYCHRHPDLAADAGADAGGNACPQCGKALQNSLKAKRRRFCSDTCRTAWWAAHRSEMRKAAFYPTVCANCGMRFLSYGNKNRRYCSHACYIAHRYEPRVEGK